MGSHAFEKSVNNIVPGRGCIDPSLGNAELLVNVFCSPAEDDSLRLDETFRRCNVEKTELNVTFCVRSVETEVVDAEYFFTVKTDELTSIMLAILGVCCIGMCDESVPVAVLEKKRTRKKVMFDL